MTANVFVVALVLGLTVFVVWVVRNEVASVKALRGLMANRGFAVESVAPSVVVEDLRLEPRFAWRGAFAAGVDGYLIVGRGWGEPLSSQARMTSTGHYFYVWAIVPPRAGCDEAWRRRWVGDARAVARPDGGVVVYWQGDYRKKDVARCLDQLAASFG